MLQKTQYQNPSFKGVFKVEGTPCQIDDLVKYFNTLGIEHKILDPVQFLSVSSSEKIVPILTDDDLDLSNKLPEGLENAPAVNLDKFFNLNERLYPDFINSDIVKMKDFHHKDMFIRSCQSTSLKNNAQFGYEIQSVKFNKPLELNDVVSKLYKLGKGIQAQDIFFNFSDYCIRFFENTELLNKTKNIINDKITALSGFGGSNTALETQSGKIFKIADLPNAPINDIKGLDVASEKKMIIEDSSQEYYVTLQQNISNWIEERIFPHQELELIEKIKKTNYHYHDLKAIPARQIGLDRQKNALLLDASCVLRKLFC